MNFCTKGNNYISCRSKFEKGFSYFLANMNITGEGLVELSFIPLSLKVPLFLRKRRK